VDQRYSSPGQATDADPTGHGGGPWFLCTIAIEKWAPSAGTIRQLLHRLAALVPFFHQHASCKRPAFGQRAFKFVSIVLPPDLSSRLAHRCCPRLSANTAELWHVVASAPSRTTRRQSARPVSNIIAQVISVMPPWPGSSLPDMPVMHTRHDYRPARA